MIIEISVGVGTVISTYTASCLPPHTILKSTRKFKYAEQMLSLA